MARVLSGKEPVRKGRTSRTPFPQRNMFGKPKWHPKQHPPFLEQNGMRRRDMRRPQRNNKPLFLGVGREGERPDALPRAANVRRMNGIVPPRRSHRRRRQQMIGTRGRGDHNNQPIFGGWRRDAVATIAVATIARAMIARRAQRRAPGRAAESSEREEDERIFPPSIARGNGGERAMRKTHATISLFSEAGDARMRQSRRRDDRDDATIATT